MPDILFLYGTLHPDRAPAEIAPAARLLKPFGGGRNRATIQARVYDLGAYPGAILSDDPADILSGELFILPEDPSVLVRLDLYEDFRPADPTNSLFLRVQVLATLREGPDTGREIASWVYIYNHPVC